MGCGEIRPKSQLRRVVLADGRVEADPLQRRTGRGAYVCDRDCGQRALARHGFERSFRCSVVVAADLLDWV